MINERLVPYIIGMTEQSDRTGLLSHLLTSINKWLGPETSRFFDIHRERIKDRSGRETVRHILFEPLNPIKKAILSSSIEGTDQCLTEKTENLFSRVVEGGRIKRYIIPAGSGVEYQSLMMIDFPVGTEEKSQLIKLFLEMFNHLQETIRAKDQDPLTGLYNRRSFDENISQVLDSISHTSHPNRVQGDGACLAVFDIDHFKKVNDVFGHTIGDEVLILFARIMERIFRHGDKLYRFGGEEFLAILVEVDQEKALLALERFRQTLESYEFPQVGRVTVSIGSIMVNQDDYPSVLIEKADQALYYSKEHGRNQVNSYDLLIKTGAIANIDHSADDIELW